MSRSFALLLCMTGCWTAPDPALLQLSESTELARQGEEALADGRYGESIAAFVKARSLSPENPNLALWHAMAASESGDNTVAVQVLDALIETPVGAELQVAHHNRAAYLMRMGRANQALVSLAHAHRRGLINPEIVMSDPDFQSLREQGVLLFLNPR
jgi:Flp pilus assembly protein TadD